MNRTAPITLLLCTVLTTAALAADLRVPQDVATIQGAIDLATDGDRILIAPGAYLERIAIAGKSIVVESTDGAAATVIDGGGTIGHVVSISGAADTVLRGLTITGGRGEAGSNGAGPGGGVAIAGASVLIEDCIVTDNTGIFGAGLSIDDATAEVRGTLFAGNQALRGGAIDVAEGSLDVAGCVFDGNRATNDGGAIASLWQTSLTVADSEFTANASGQFGGAVYTNLATVDLARLSFADNGEGSLQDDGVSWSISTIGGGAVYTTDTSGRIEASRFLRNVAAFGSGIYVAGGGTLEVVNTLIADGPIGVPFWSNASSPVVTNCTIAGNQNAIAEIFTTYNAAPTVNNTILTGSGVPTAGNGLTTLNHCLYVGTPYAAVIGAGNVEATDALLDAQADYAPLPGSPAIDAGSNALVPADITTDLLGNLRFVDDPDTPDSGDGQGPLVDMGAIEFGSWDPALDTIAAAALPSSSLLDRVHAAPNPFNPRTEVRFTLARDAEVAVDIVDARGLRVSTLRPGTLAAGTHGLTWDGTDREGRALASGVYLAVVRAADQRERVKLTLVR